MFGNMLQDMSGSSASAFTNDIFANANASMALALSAHTPRVPISVYIVSTCWHSELGYDTPSRYLASAGTPANEYYYYIC